MRNIESKTNRRILSLAAIGVLGVTATLGVDKVSSDKAQHAAHMSLPACEYIVHGGETIDGIKAKLGNQPEPLKFFENDRTTPVTINADRLGLQPNMIALEPHVNPDVCMQAGGSVGHSTNGSIIE